jgi:hypothetical protein
MKSIDFVNTCTIWEIARVTFARFTLYYHGGYIMHCYFFNTIDFLNNIDLTRYIVSFHSVID